MFAASLQYMYIILTTTGGGSVAEWLERRIWNP